MDSVSEKAFVEQGEAGFSVHGVLDFDNVIRLSRAGESIIKSFSPDKGCCFVDLAKLEEKNTSALALLLTWLRAAKKSGVTLKFLSSSDSLCRMSETFGLTEILPNG